MTTARGYAVGSHAARRRRDSAEIMLGPPRRRETRTVVAAVLAAVVLGAAAGAVPVPTLLVVAAIGVVLLALRLDLAAVAVVAVAPFEQAVDVVLPGPGAWALTAVPLALLAASWALGWRGRRRRERVAVPAATRRVAAALVLLAVLGAVVALSGPGAASDRAGDVAGRVAPVLLALVVLAALRGRLTLRRLVGVHVVAAVVASALTVALLLTRSTPGAWDSERLVPWAVTALPLLLAVRGGRHAVVASAGFVVLLGALLLQVARGVASPSVVVGLAVVLLLAGATGQLGVRRLTGVVALTLLVLGVVPVLAGGPDRAVLDAGGLAGPGAVELAALAVAVAVGLWAAWPRWRAERDPVAGAVCLALVGVGTTTALAGGLDSPALWLVVAVAGATAARVPDAVAS